MREIKFKAKRVDGKGWVEGDLIHGVNHKKGRVFILPIKGGVQSLSSGIDPIDGWEVAPNTVCQYTGLKDKNGNEVFEGDSLILCNNKNGFVNVEFKNEYVGGWVLTNKTTDHHVSLGARTKSELELTGKNIHD